MKVYTFVFYDESDTPAGTLGIREDGYARLPDGNEIVPHLVRVGDSIRISPHPRSVQVVREILVAEQE